MSYLNRCQFLLQQGRFVADVLYYYGNHVPNIARLKKDDPAQVLPQYDYDVINEEVLLQASVREGRVALPSGMRYRVLVLPNLKGLSLEVARKLRELVAGGADRRSQAGPYHRPAGRRRAETHRRRTLGQRPDYFPRRPRGGGHRGRRGRYPRLDPTAVPAIPTSISSATSKPGRQPTKSVSGSPASSLNFGTPSAVGAATLPSPSRKAARLSRWSCSPTARCSWYFAGRQPAVARAATGCRLRRLSN